MNLSEQFMVARGHRTIGFQFQHGLEHTKWQRNRTGRANPIGQPFRECFQVPGFPPDVLLCEIPNAEGLLRRGSHQGPGDGWRRCFGRGRGLHRFRDFGKQHVSGSANLEFDHESLHRLKPLETAAIIAGREQQTGVASAHSHMGNQVHRTGCDDRSHPFGRLLVAINLLRENDRWTVERPALDGTQ